MARIIHIEDKLEWIELTRDALADYEIDSADSYAAALALIRSGAPYDLALVDLNLERDDDGLGGEILDLLKEEYPSTRRIVVTGNLPEGSLRRNIFERYGIDEVIIKGTMRLRDLRKVVAAALNSDVDDSTREMSALKADLKVRFYSWRDRLEALSRARLSDAHGDARGVRRRTGHPDEEARQRLDRWLEFQRRFQEDSGRMERIISDANNKADVESANLLFDKMAIEFLNNINRNTI